ncbi:MAG: outer membrane lipoprotein-sorting protein [Gammaproteobacteria bacterium]|nr:outer membrane lipoprotein-sorting protein [Gammaproteobacteria bacterium]
MSARIIPGVVLAGCCLFAASGIATAEEDVAARIMQRVYEVYGGDDSFSRLRFSFEYDGGKTGTLGLVMAYKRYPATAGAESKVVMFNDYPPEKKDIGYLGWFYRVEQERDADQWLYLPELRQTRKLTRKPRDYSRTEKRTEGDEFSVSELDLEELAPRAPVLDRHTLLGSETLEGRAVYTVESVPTDPDSSPYGKRIAWISKDGYLPLRVDCYDREAHLVKTLNFTWAQVDKDWVWERVIAVNRVNGNKTLLEQSDVLVNLGLPDDLFAKRVLDQGADTFARRMSRYVR